MKIRLSAILGAVLVLAILSVAWYSLTPAPDHPSNITVAPAAVVNVALTVANADNVRFDAATKMTAVQDRAEFQIKIFDIDGKQVAGPVSGRLGGWHKDGSLQYFDREGRKWRMDPSTFKVTRVIRPIPAQDLRGGHIASISENIADQIKEGDTCPVLGGQPRRIEKVEVEVRQPGLAFTRLHLEASS